MTHVGALLLKTTSRIAGCYLLHYKSITNNPELTKSESSKIRYPDDMGPLRPRTIKILGLRDGPHIETRTKRYTDFLLKDGPIQCTEVVITFIKGGGVALITSLPKKLSKKCKRQGISYKLGDVIITVDMLTKAPENISSTTLTIAGTIEYVKSASIKIRRRTILVSDLILPADLQESSRSQLLPCESRLFQQGASSIDVYCLQLNDIAALREEDS